MINPLSEPTYLIMLALYQGPLHGYGIIKAIENVSRGIYVIAPGTLYGVIKNIQKKGWIQTIEIESGSRRRITYRITDDGKEALLAEYNKYINLIHMSKIILHESEE
ncbi:PadR family transcriptional regulator [Virgibacillus pantothenticus]|nr:PadR family transcriptional regulator [Virgibacillus pantothenticus]MBU8602978.1 PadR family transcriptional regulator [Virgibacillus pantothenticus]MBU8637070.1 PadR family transcriptional regulator [Virgibacillus pantothenticus]MBU8644862.1 PadR family transcriptional regulator [Virgibacillus pantothenticus]MBU8662776.1 PadR family transcriptional regulator [Virgibacillus pantothenticus]MBU8666893.1 PadR family transcriptional regulator [Virgibacillus pantothenticus]